MAREGRDLEFKYHEARADLHHPLLLALSLLDPEILSAAFLSRLPAGVRDGGFGTGCFLLWFEIGSARLFLGGDRGKGNGYFLFGLYCVGQIPVRVCRGRSI